MQLTPGKAPESTGRHSSVPPSSLRC
jgi:hypothetical protein